MRKRILSFLLSAAMILTMAPATVYADENVNNTSAVVETQSSQEDSESSDTTQASDKEGESEKQTVSETESASPEEDSSSLDVMDVQASGTESSVLASASADTADSEQGTSDTEEKVYSATFADNGTMKYEADYTGQQITPEVVVKDQYGEVLDPSNYDVDYGDTRTVGRHYITVKGLGAYKDIDLQLVIIINSVSTPITSCTIRLASGISGSNKFYYTGAAISPKVTVKDGTTTLTQNTDYTVSYSKNKTVGTATVKIAGKGDYTGTKTLTFKIVKNKIANFKVSLAKTKYAYTGKSIKAGVTVKSSSAKLTTSDYKVSYKNNKKMGTATVTITGKGSNVYGTKKLTFKIVPAATKLKATASSKGISLKWNKVTGATGYYVYRAADSGSYTKIATTKNRYYLDTKAIAGTEYTYYIVSYKGSYKSSASNKVTGVRTLAAPTIKSITNTGTALKITWTKVSGATSYKLCRRAAGEDWIAIYRGTGTTFTDTIAVLNTKYYYKVAAVTDSMESKSATVSATRTKKTTTAADGYGLSVKRDSSNLKTFYASWSKVSGATKYEILWCTDKTFPASTRHFGYTKNTHFEPQVKYVGAGTWYVKVRAIKVSGKKTTYSKWSTIKTLKIK